MSFGFLEVSFSIAVTAIIFGSYLLGYVKGHNARDIELWNSVQNIEAVPTDSSSEKLES